MYDYILKRIMKNSKIIHEAKLGQRNNQSLKMSLGALVELGFLVDEQNSQGQITLAQREDLRFAIRLVIEGQ